MDHVRQHFICDFDRAQCVARDLGRCRGDSRDGSARKANFGKRRRDDCFHTWNLRCRISIELCDARVCVWAAKHAGVKHAGQALIVRVFRDARGFEWTINTRHAVVEQFVFVVWTPAWSSVRVDFNLDHLFDAVNDARNADLLFRLGRW